MSSSPVTGTQIVAVIAAVLFILGIGDAELVSQLTGWTGLLPPPTKDTIPASKDAGETEAPGL